MPYSTQNYTGTGIVGPYTVPFSYLDKSHVEVYLNGALTTAYTWLTASTIQFNSTVAAGVTIFIKRNTPKDARIINFQDAVILLASDSNNSDLQSFFICQEILDSAGISVQNDGTLTTSGRRLAGADGTSTSDYVTVSQLTSAVFGSIPLPLPLTSGGTGATSASGARTALGLGSAALLAAGTAASNLVQLDGSAKLPAVDGSQLTNLPIPTVGAPRGYIAGLSLSNNGANIDVSAGVARDSTNAVDITLNAAVTGCILQASGAWAAGNSANKLDAGAKANSTWYHVFVIRTAAGVSDVLFSTSPSAPTMPSGYTTRRRVGSIVTDGSGNIRTFVQTGDVFRWKTAVSDQAAATIAASTPTSYTITVPSGVKVIAHVNVEMSNAASGSFILVKSPDETDETPNGGSSRPVPSGGWNGTNPHSFNVHVPTNASGQIRLNPAASGSTTFWIDTIGWRDFRGVND